MHTIIRAIATCAGWVAGLFRGADAPKQDHGVFAFWDNPEDEVWNEFGDAHEQVARGDG